MGLKLGLNFKIMTGGYNNKNYDRCVKKKKNMTVDRRHRFRSISSVTDSSNTVVADIDSAVVVGATITTIGPLVMAVQWSKTPIWWAIGPPPQVAPLAEPPVLLVYLKYKFKLKKYNIRENNKKLMNNEYFIEKSCKIDKLMLMFCKSDGVK